MLAPLLHSTLRPHNTSSKEFTNNPESISGSCQFPLEQIMLISRVNLALSDGAHGCICWRTDRALGILVKVIQATFMEGVLAEEMDSGEIQSPAAGLAAARLEDDGFVG